MIIKNVFVNKKEDVTLMGFNMLEIHFYQDFTLWG